MKTLTQKQNIRLASWSFATARVGYVEGEDADRARRNGHDIAYATYAGSCISSSPHYYDRMRAEHAAATVVADGEHVMINGVEYAVKVVPGNGGEFPRNCDPIHFKPVLKEAA